MSNWWPSILSSGAMAILLSALAFAYKTLFEKGVQAKLDTGLEELKSSLRRDEEAVKAKLQRQDVQLESLRSGALTNMAARHLAIQNRRQAAVENVWKAALVYVQISYAFPLIGAMSEVYDDMSKLSAADKNKVADFCTAIEASSPVDLVSKHSEIANIEQIYIDPASWATFSVVRNICSTGRLHLMMLKIGKPLTGIDISKVLIQPLVGIMPEQEAYLKEHGTLGVYQLLPALQAKLFHQLRNHLEGADADEKMMAVTAHLLEKSYQTDALINAGRIYQ